MTRVVQRADIEDRTGQHVIGINKAAGFFFFLGVSDRIANEIINAGCVHGATETKALISKTLQAFNACILR
ncbi:Uncharacterised protein [Klebsiella pneumoniae]|nr:Uncharacterised protein [Klebsiella pneumoniae]